MKSWTTNGDVQIYQVLKRRCNSYLLTSKKTRILVDTGLSSSYEILKNNIKQVLLTEPKINYLFLTHTHFDHCQTAKKIKDEFNCQIVVSKKAQQSIIKGYTRIPNGTLFSTKILAKFGQLIGKRRFGYEPFKPDILISSDNIFQLDSFNIKIIETGGHTPDSICFIVDDEIAIVGDEMFGVFNNSVFPPYADNIKKMIESWGKLLQTNCKLFLPGHGKALDRNLVEKEFLKYVKKYKL